MFDFFGGSKLFDGNLSFANGDFFSNFNFQKNIAVNIKKKRFSLDLKAFIAAGILMALGHGNSVAYPLNKEEVGEKFSIAIPRLEILGAEENPVKLNKTTAYDLSESGVEFFGGRVYFSQNSHLIDKNIFHEKNKSFISSKIINILKNSGVNFHKFPDSEYGFWIQSGLTTNPLSIFIDADGYIDGKAFYMNEEGKMISSSFSIDDFSEFDKLLGVYINKIIG